MDDEGRDRLSNMPDVILHHIFSFLPMKDVIRTSILAKRWEDLWFSAPKLIFYDQTTDKRTLFLNLVAKALVFRDSSIEKFSLGCNLLLKTNVTRFRLLISAALRHEVQELDLKVKGSLELLKLPPRFTCESLVSLTLNLGHIQLPSYTWFPNLKQLKLKGLTFPDQHSTEQLFNGCPILEELTIKNCHSENIRVLRISSVRLKKLEIINNKLYVEAQDDDSDSNFCKIWILGDSLESFSFLGDFIDCYVIIGASLIAEASVQIWESKLPFRDLVYCVGVLLNGLSNVDLLQLHDFYIWELIRAEEFLAELPVFTNLTCLKIDVFDWRPFQKVLQKTPRLGTIFFERGIELDPYDGKGEWMLGPVPQCFSTHLKKIVVWCFLGFQDEVNAVEMLLKHVKVLEKLVIVSVPESGNERQRMKNRRRMKKAQEKILSLPRTSVDCVIRVSVMLLYFQSSY